MAQVCPKCSSSTIIETARIRTAHEHDIVRLAVDSDPDALLLKGTQYSELLARVCAKCGYTEFYAADVAPLAAAYERSQGQS